MFRNTVQVYSDDYCIRSFFLSKDKRLIYMFFNAEIKVFEIKSNKIINSIKITTDIHEFVDRYINDDIIEFVNCRAHERTVYNEKTNTFESPTTGTYILMHSDDDPVVSLYCDGQKIDEMPNNMFIPIAHKNHIYYIATSYENSQFPLMKLTYEEGKITLNKDPYILGKNVLRLDARIQIDKKHEFLLVFYASELLVFKLDSLEYIRSIPNVLSFNNKYFVEASYRTNPTMWADHIVTVREIHNTEKVYYLDLKKGPIKQMCIPFKGSYYIILIGEMVMIQSISDGMSTSRLYNIQRGYLCSFQDIHSSDDGYLNMMDATEDTLYNSVGRSLKTLDISMYSKKNQMSTLLIGTSIIGINAVRKFTDNVLFDRNLLGLIGEFV